MEQNGEAPEIDLFRCRSLRCFIHQSGKNGLLDATWTIDYICVEKSIPTSKHVYFLKVD